MLSSFLSSAISYLFLDLQNLQLWLCIVDIPAPVLVVYVVTMYSWEQITTKLVLIASPRPVSIGFGYSPVGLLYPCAAIAIQQTKSDNSNRQTNGNSIRSQICLNDIFGSFLIPFIINDLICKYMKSFSNKKIID